MNADYVYDDFDEQGAIQKRKVELWREEIDGHSFPVVHDKSASQRDVEATVPNGQIYLVGDNRENSYDSRFFGPVPLTSVLGKAVMIWWSDASGSEVRWGRIGQPVE